LSRGAVTLVIPIALIVGFVLALFSSVFVPDTRGWAVPTALAIVIFAIMLNGHLYGASKDQIDAVLAFPLIGLLAWSFFLFGWRVGLLYLVLGLIFGRICNSAAKPIARWMLGA